MSSKVLCTVLGALVGAGSLVVSGAAADGGPSPGVEMGWGGVATPDGTIRYVALPTGARTVVAVIRTRDGRVLRYGGIPGSFGIPRVAYDGSADGVTRDGKTLVLATYVGPSARSTRFAVLSTKTLRRQKLVTLRGSWSFDALSPNGRTMYLIQYIAASDSARYRVRAYDLAATRLLPQPIIDKTEPEPMVGSPVTRAASAGGAWVYTLYARNEGEPFIHALDTVNRVARCIDLDWGGSAEALWRMRLAFSSNGQKIELRGPNGKAALVVDAPRR